MERDEPRLQVAVAMSAQTFDAGRLTEFVVAKVRRNNEERRAAWRWRVCASIDAARRATPITADELRARNDWRMP